MAKLSAEFVVDPPVNLQSATPGTAQVGHINVTGTVLAGNVFATISGNTGKAVSGFATSPTGFVFGGDFRSYSTDGRGVFGSATTTTGFTYGGDFRSASVDGRGVFGYATNVNGQGIGGDFRSDSPFGTGIIGRAESTSGTPIGVWGKAASNGYAGQFDGRLKVQGDASFASNVSALSLSGDGNGLYNLNAATLGGYTSSNFLKSNPPVSISGNVSGYILYTENVSSAGGASGLYGVSNTASGATRGVVGLNTSSSGFGVYGDSTASSGAAYGVVGQSHSTTGYGVFGESLSGTGKNYGTVGTIHSPDGGFGVYGSVQANTGAAYGVIGVNPSSAGYAVFASGNFACSGTKAFRIDYPFDPTNKYLLHYSTESPVPQNFYSGNVTTDSRGYAWVELPGYFQEINANFKYQLTVISSGDAFVQAMVSKEISDNRFQVRTSSPNIKVSWRVEADRNDPFVQKNHPRDIVDKQGLEIGTYSNPEVYGQSADKGFARLDNSTSTASRNVPPLKK